MAPDKCFYKKVEGFVWGPPPYGGLEPSQGLSGVLIRMVDLAALQAPLVGTLLVLCKLAFLLRSVQLLTALEVLLFQLPSSASVTQFEWRMQFWTGQRSSRWPLQASLAAAPVCQCCTILSNATLDTSYFGGPTKAPEGDFKFLVRQASFVGHMLFSIDQGSSK